MLASFKPPQHTLLLSRCELDTPEMRVSEKVHGRSQDSPRMKLEGHALFYGLLLGMDSLGNRNPVNFYD